MKMRRWWMLLLLFALLGVVVVLNRVVADWRPVVSGTAGELLYAASFAGAAADGLNTEWDQYPGRLSAEIADGDLTITVGEGMSLPYSLTRARYGDVDVRVRATTRSEPLDNGFGIVFRLQDQNNNYRFVISADGYYQVVRVVNGESRDLSTWIPSPHIHIGVGALNELRLVARGDHFRFYINGELVGLCIPDDPQARSTYNVMTGECVGGTMRDTLIDSSFKDGRLGVIALATPSGGEGVQVSFHDVIVYSPTDDA